MEKNNGQLPDMISMVLNWHQKFGVDIGEKYNGHPNPQDKNESCPYDYVKDAFVKQINLIIEQRIKHYL